jgi:cell division protein FtsN
MTGRGGSGALPGRPGAQAGGTALGVIVGLLLGLALALAVALYVTKVPVPLLNKAQQRTPEQDAAEAERNKNWDPNAALTGKPTTRADAPVVSQPASDVAIVPRGNAPVLPTAADSGKVTPLGKEQSNPATLAGNAAAAARADASPHSSRDAAAILAGADVPNGATALPPAVDPFVYFVQVGAYSNADDAEQQRAKLALAGFRATVTEREQNGRTVHRVRLGPFDKKDDADALQERVKDIAPEASLVRVERAKQ